MIRPSFALIAFATTHGVGANYGSVNAHEKAIFPVVPPDDKTPIHISISAFFDGDRCANTLKHAFEEAEHPSRLTIGVVQAREGDKTDCRKKFRDEFLPGVCKSRFPGDSDCFSSLSKKVVQKTIRPEEGEGPNHQRSMSQSLIEFDRDDKMCMQLDSHMDFLKNWDSLLLQDFVATKNEFAVLTAYPLDFSAKSRAMETRVDCCGYQDEGGIPRGRGCGDMPREPDAKPILTTLWAAGLSFHRCHAEKNVPIDPNLEFIFTGEEVDRATRLWTSGYDLYLPTRGTVLHDYGHAQQSFWNSVDSETAHVKEKRSQQKLRSLLHLGQTTGDVGKYYGLGTQRTLDEWNHWAQPFLEATCSSRKLKRHGVRDTEALRASLHVTQMSSMVEIDTAATTDDEML